MLITLTTVAVFLSLHSGVNGGFGCGKDGLFANPFNANSYFQCKSGMATLNQCEEGTVWNQDKEFCHWKPAKGKYQC